MCGIHGIYQLDASPAPAEWLARMGRVTAHRGPDDFGAHADGRCAIGMRRLAIIDLSGGHQPIPNHDASLVVVCNGEIYNFRELRRELQGYGHQFRTDSDSEVVLHSYAQWGEGFVDRLNGMFGFALWDRKRQTLLVGRDRLGIKPVYWLSDGKRFAFASEAKALLELPGVAREVDPTALAAYLELGYVPAPLALVKGRERIYLEHFWNDFAADRKRSVPEADRRLYAKAYAQPGAMRAGFEPSVSHRLKLDHGACIPLWRMGLEKLPRIVPLLVNAIEPPMPSLERCLGWGGLLRRAIESYRAPLRVAIVATGGLSHSIGEPTMGAIHEDFDRETLRCFSSSDESLIPYLEKELPRRGNGSEEVRNWLVAHGAALGRGFELVDYLPVPTVLVGCGFAAWKVE